MSENETPSANLLKRATEFMDLKYGSDLHDLYFNAFGIIRGYQDLIRRMLDTMEAMDLSVNSHGLIHQQIDNMIREARASISEDIH